jgi:hypothetical protein
LILTSGGPGIFDGKDPELHDTNKVDFSTIFDNKGEP